MMTTSLDVLAVRIAARTGMKETYARAALDLFARSSSKYTDVNLDAMDEEVARAIEADFRRAQRAGEIDREAQGLVAGQQAQLIAAEREVLRARQQRDEAVMEAYMRGVRIVDLTRVSGLSRQQIRRVLTHEAEHVPGYQLPWG